MLKMRATKTKMPKDPDELSSARVPALFLFQRRASGSRALEVFDADAAVGSVIMFALAGSELRRPGQH